MRRDHDGHPAQAEGQLLVQAAGEDGAEGRRAVEDARRFGCRDLADTVAKHERGHEPERLEGVAGGGLNGEEQRLRNLGQLELCRQILRPQGLDDRPSGHRREIARDGVEARAEHGVALVGRQPHADELAAVAGKDEGDGRFAFDGRGARCACHVLVLVAKRVERPDQGIALADRDDNAMGQAIPTMHGRRQEGSDVGIRHVIETRRVIRDERAQRRPTVGGKHEVGRGRVDDADGPSRSIREDDMRIASAEAEGIDAGEAPLAGQAGQRRQASRHGQVQGLEVDMRVQIVAVQRGRKLILLQSEHRLQHAAEGPMPLPCGQYSS